MKKKTLTWGDKGFCLPKMPGRYRQRDTGTTRESWLLKDAQAETDRSPRVVTFQSMAAPPARAWGKNLAETWQRLGNSPTRLSLRRDLTLLKKMSSSRRQSPPGTLDDFWRISGVSVFLGFSGVLTRRNSGIGFWFRSWVHRRMMGLGLGFGFEVAERSWWGNGFLVRGFNSGMGFLLEVF